MTLTLTKTRPAIATGRPRFRMKLLTATIAISVLVNAAARADDFFDSYAQAQPVISRAVAAYGGEERLQGIRQVHLRTEGPVHLRYQSRHLGPPFDTNEGWTDIALDRDSGSLSVETGGPVFVNRQVVTADGAWGMDLIRQTWSEPANPPDPNTHFVYRVVPALLVQKIHQRAANVRHAGTSTISGRAQDVLSVAWDNGTVYGVHVDRETGLISRYDILAPDPVVGDTVYESYFEDYRPVDGVPFPYRRWQQVDGQKTYEARTVAVSINSDVSGFMALPEGFTEVPAAPPPATALRELADGVYLGNGNYQNLYVDTGEYLVSVDAGGGAGQIRGELEQLTELSGGKPLKYAVITHHHNDHTAGVDALAAAGATVVTTKDNREYLAGIIKGRRYLSAATPATDVGEVEFLLVGDSHTFPGDNEVRIHRVPNGHADDYFVAFVPAARLLYGADVFNFPATGPLAPSNPQFAEFYENLTRLDLGFDTVANSHGRLGTADELSRRAKTGMTSTARATRDP